MTSAARETIRIAWIKEIQSAATTAESAPWWRWGGTVGNQEYVARSTLGQDAPGNPLDCGSLQTVARQACIVIARVGIHRAARRLPAQRAGPPRRPRQIPRRLGGQPVALRPPVRPQRAGINRRPARLFWQAGNVQALSAGSCSPFGSAAWPAGSGSPSPSAACPAASWPGAILSRYLLHSSLPFSRIQAIKLSRPS
jgi:hypothetical protein